MDLKERLKDIFNVQKYSTIWLAAVVIIAAIVTSYLYVQNERTKKLLANPQEAAKEQSKSIIDKVARIIDVPNEDPQIATVSDSNKLKNQPFFAKAENGDKVLIYSNTGRAILYRPSTNKIIEVAPINRATGGPNTNGSVTNVSMKDIKVAIYNGSGKAGLAGSTESKLKSKYPEITVVTKENAVKSDYKDNIVVDVKGGKTTQAEAIAGVVGGKVGSIPDGELKPDADILIIVAK